MNQRYLRYIALLLLVWLASQQVVASVLHGMNHSLDSCHEQMISSVDCSSRQAEGEHGSHRLPSSTSQMLVCDHCATFCQPVIMTSLSIPPVFEGQLTPILEPDLSILASASSVPYRPPIIA